MIGESDLRRMLSDLPRDRAANVDFFLRQASFDHVQFEGTLRQQLSDLIDVFYVSTVARGLAGSMSDIDVVAITAARPDFRRMSTMVHAQGRRLGVKHYAADELGRVDQVLTQDWPPEALVRPVESWETRAPVDWVDCERLANGFSYLSGAPFSRFLPALSQLWLWEALLRAREAAVAALLSAAAGERRAPAGYLMVGLGMLRECVMAQCGDIQSNSKWTGERWSRFWPCIEDREIAAVARRLDDDHDWLRATRGSDPAEAASRLRSAYTAVRGFTRDVALDDAHLFRGLAERPRRQFFLASVGIALARGQVAMMPQNHPLLGHPLALNELERTPPDIATQALVLLRSGSVDLSGVAPGAIAAAVQLRRIAPYAAEPAE